MQRVLSKDKERKIESCCRSKMQDNPSLSYKESKKRSTYAVLGELLNELRLLILSKLVSFHFIHFA